MSKKKVNITVEVEEDEIFRSVENQGYNPGTDRDDFANIVTNVFITGKDKNGNKIRVDIIDSVDLESIE